MRNNEHARYSTWILFSAAVFSGLAVPLSVAAQPEAPGQHTETVETTQPEEIEDDTAWQASAGGTHQAGNTKAVQINAGTLLELMRYPHGFLAELNFVYGMAVVDEESDGYERTAENLRGRLRYDFFLSEMDALFAASQARRDPFAGLDLRLQGQVGYMRSFYRVENHRFWGEIGYDLTYDDFYPNPLLDDMGNELDGSAVVHSARGFLGYDNQLNKAVTFRTGLETLVNVENPEDVRINWDTALRSSLMDQLQVEVKFTLLADTQPVPGAKGYDTITNINLVYTLI